jgi:hypothetical protein
MDKFKPHNPLVDSFMTIFIYNLMKKWKNERNKKYFILYRI